MKVNYRFASTVARLARPGELVWIHDFHLQLVPRMLRQIRRDLRIGFFMHIPFPPEELFAWLPWRTQILEGLLGADVVGFQTVAGAQNFSRLARQYELAEGAGGELIHAGRLVNVASFPISIDFGLFDELAARPETVALASQIRRRIGASRKIVLAVDRLDYTKGIDARLAAFGELLASGRVTVDQCVLVQIAVPSREVVAEYQDMRTLVEQTVGRLNGEFSGPGRVAVHYFRRSLPRGNSSPTTAADVMLVHLRRHEPGAKEPVASAPTTPACWSCPSLPALPGARRLLVNPRDTDQMSGAIESALRLPRQDSRQRMAILRTVVRRHDVHEWADSFLQAMAG